MKIEVDTHTHTLVSGHAYNTMKEMAKEAVKRGLKGLAITEHAPDMPGGPNIYYFHNLRVVPRDAYGIELLLGVELNIRNKSGEVDLPEKLLGQLDIAVASLHTQCFSDELNEEEVTCAYVNVMENPYVDIIGHPDDSRAPVNYKKLVEAAKRTGTLLEVNNSSFKPTTFRQRARENVLEMLHFCKEYGAMVVLGTDSHVDATLGDYAYTEEVLREADFPEELVANTSLEKLKSSMKRGKKR